MFFFFEEGIKYNKDYKYIDNLVFTKNYSELLKVLGSFIGTHLEFIKSRLKSKTMCTNRLKNFLNICGPESYYCVKSYYCEIDKKEIKSDIICCILTLASRYEYKDRHFISYLSNAFYYEFARTIFYYLKEMNHHDGFKAYLDCIDDNLYDEKDIIENNLDKILGYISIDNELTEKWIDTKFNQGESSFYLLNPFEKRLLIMYYQKNIDDRTISELLDKHINTINTKRRQALKKLEQAFNIKHIRTRKYMTYNIAN